MLPAYAGMIRRAGHSGPGCGVLPAYAGMIPTFTRLAAAGLSAPRVCGDDPPFVTFTIHQVRCSPRMRG